MISKIKPEEFNRFLVLSHPVGCSEVLFNDFDNLGIWDKEQCGKVRLYQYQMLSWDGLYINDKKLTPKENFDIKKEMAEAYNFGGRLTGKSIISIILDCLISTFNKLYKKCVISSFDAIHVRGVFELLISSFENHKIMKHLKGHILRSPAYKADFENGCLLESVNDKITGKNPGNGYFQKHFDRHYKEEGSMLTPEVSSKLLMSQSELGCIDRWSGMTTFSRHSPIGKIFCDLKNNKKIVNLPSYVNPSWNDEKEQDAIVEFGGRQSVGYRVQIQGEVIEDSDSVYDMSRIRNTYNRKKDIKIFEINKNNFYRFREMLIIEKPKNASFSYVCADIGEGSAPTEIIFIFKINDKYRYIYNITFNRLSADEQYEIFKFVIEKVSANFVGIDTTSGMGKAIASRLTKDYPENIIWVSFNEKIRIDYEKDDKGEFIVDTKGNYQYKEEYITDWSIQRLKHLFYENKMEIPVDYKLDLQFSNIVTTKSGLRTIYASKIANHLHQAFQVFSIVEWQGEFANIKPVTKKQVAVGVMGSI